MSTSWLAFKFVIKFCFEKKMDPTKIYVPPGLVRDHAKLLDKTVADAKKDIVNRVFELCAMYEGGGSLLYWTKRDRTALNSILCNHLADETTKKTMLRDLAGCDEVLLRLKDLLSFVMKCNSRAKFIVKISSFTERLSTHDLGLFQDCLMSLRDWTSGGLPEKPSENDLFLLEVYKDMKENVPASVDKGLQSDFCLDRLAKIDKIIDSVKKGEKL